MYIYAWAGFMQWMYLNRFPVVYPQSFRLRRAPFPLGEDASECVFRTLSYTDPCFRDVEVMEKLSWVPGKKGEILREFWLRGLTGREANRRYGVSQTHLYAMIDQLGPWLKREQARREENRRRFKQRCQEKTER
jgi:hypothetical protein